MTHLQPASCSVVLPAPFFVFHRHFSRQNVRSGKPVIFCSLFCFLLCAFVGVFWSRKVACIEEFLSENNAGIVSIHWSFSNHYCFVQGVSASCFLFEPVGFEITCQENAFLSCFVIFICMKKIKIKHEASYYIFRPSLLHTQFTCCCGDIVVGEKFSGR